LRVTELNCLRRRATIWIDGLHVRSRICRLLERPGSKPRLVQRLQVIRGLLKPDLIHGGNPWPVAVIPVEWTDRLIIVNALLIVEGRHVTHEVRRVPGHAIQKRIDVVVSWSRRKAALLTPAYRRLGLKRCPPPTLYLGNNARVMC